jgi:hypothetical protein
MKYQGWSNHETWCINLWLTNDVKLYHGLIEYVNDDDAGGLKNWVEDMQPDLGCSIWDDLITTALGEVNWYEIIESNKEDPTDDGDRAYDLAKEEGRI